MIVITCGGAIMAVSYKKLFHLLIEQDMTTSQLQKKAGFSANIIARLKRNGSVSLETIESICRKYAKTANIEMVKREEF